MIGPSIKLVIRCWDCDYRISKCYIVQSDSGVDDYCGHPNFSEKVYMRDSTVTPAWCPERIEAIDKFLLEMKLNKL